MTAPHTTAKQAFNKATHQSRPWVKALARMGYIAKGVVYIIIGLLSFQAAFGSGGTTTDSQGALHKIAGQPFGGIMLGLVGIGLVGYALWRIVQAALDPDGKGSDISGIFTRIGYVFSGIAYGGLAFTAFKILTNSRGGGGSSQQDWTAKLLSQPFGPWLVGIVAAITIGLGLNAFRKAITAKFLEKLDTSSMTKRENDFVTMIGRAGYGARGVVMLIIGWFFIQAARAADADKSGGIEKALDALARETPWLFGIVAIGLIAYGAYALAEARYRKI